MAATKEELQQALLAAHRAGDTASAAKLAAELNKLDNPPSIASRIPTVNPMGLARGIGDMAVSAARGLVNRPALSAQGLVGAVQGAIDPNMTAREGFAQAQAQGRADIETGRGLVGSEHLRTPEGRQLAQQLGSLPVISHIGRALDTIGGGIERIAGPEARDVIGSGVELATLRSPGRRPQTRGLQAIEQAKDWGYRAPPNTYVGEGQQLGSALDRTAQSVGGSEQVAARYAMANQRVTDRLAARAGGFADELPSPEALKQARQQATAVYDELKALDLPMSLNTRTFKQALQDLAQPSAGFPNARPARSVRLMLRGLQGSNATLPQVVDRVRELRASGYRHIKGDNVESNALGIAELKAADALDKEIDAFLVRTSARVTDPNLKAIMTRIYREYTDARTRLSVLHDIEDAMNPSTGTIDAARVAKLAEARTLHPELQKIAEAYNAIGPDGMKNAEKAVKAAQTLTPSDWAMGTVGASAGGFGGAAAAGPAGAAIGGIIGALAPSALRLGLRQYATRGEGVRAAQRATAATGRGISRAIAAGAAIDEGDEDEP